MIKRSKSTDLSDDSNISAESLSDELIEIRNDRKILDENDVNSILSITVTLADRLKTLFECIRGGRSRDFRKTICLMDDQQRTETINTMCDGTYLLHEACRTGQDEIAIFLLFSDANCFIADRREMYPQHYAAQSNKPVLIDILCVFGVDINTVDSNNNTPLHYAAMSDQPNAPKILKILEEYHADPRIKNSKNKTPIDLCKSTKMRKMLEAYALTYV